METTKRKPLFHYAIVLAFCFLFRFLPPFGGLTELGVAIVGALIGAVYGWIFIDLIWPTLVAVIAFCLTDFGITATFANSFGSYAFVALFMIFSMIALATKTDSLSWVADAIVNNKLLRGKPWVIVFTILAASWLFGVFNNIVGMVVFGAIITSICLECGVKEKNSKLAIFLYLGASMALMMGQIMFPFMSTGMVMFASFTAMFPQYHMNMAAYISFMMIMGLLIISVWTLLMRFVFRVDADPLRCYECKGSKKITRAQLTSLLIVLVFILFNFAALLPLGSFSAILNKLSIAGIAIVFVCAIIFLKGDDGEPIATLPELFKTADWGQLLLIAFTMLLSATINKPETGISTAMTNMFSPLNGLPPLAFIVGAILISIVLTNLASNLVTTIIVMPFLVTYAASAGIDPTVIVAILFVMVQFALCTPAASPTTAIAMSQPLVDVGPMMKYGFMILPILILVGFVVGIPLAQFLFAVLS